MPLCNIVEHKMCKMSPPFRCPPVKTVPYTCAPGATDTSQCIYGEVIISSAYKHPDTNIFKALTTAHSPC